MTRQHHTAYGRAPIELWRDQEARDGFWALVRQGAAATLAHEHPGWRLGDEVRRDVVYQRRVEGSTAAEATPDDADMVSVRLVIWATDEWGKPA